MSSLRAPRRAAGHVVACLLAAATVAAAPRDRQTPAPAPAPALILGQVVDASTGRPLRGAVVTLGTARGVPTVTPPGQSGPARVLADDDGRFVFRSLSAGTYTMTAAAAGYLTAAAGQRLPEGSGQPFDLRDGQRAGGVVIRLWRSATIGGKVVDEAGHPISEVTVQILRRTLVAGRTVLSPSPISTTTDDRGVYRKSGFAPGDYLVAVASKIAARPASLAALDRSTADQLRASGAFSIADNPTTAAARVGDLIVQTTSQSYGANALIGLLPTSVRPDGRVTTYATTFHPSVMSAADAAAIAVASGDERANVDIELRPAAFAPLTGTVTTPSGPAVNLAVHLIPAYAVHTLAERTFEAAIAVTDQSGRFVFPAVAPGAYVVEAWRKPSAITSLVAAASAEPALWAEQPVTVGEEPASVTLALRRGSTISGRIVLEGATAPPRPTVFQAMLGAWFQPPWPLAFTQGPLPETRVSATWEFTREGSPPGRYPPTISSSSFAPPAGWYLKSATYQDRDLLTHPLLLDGQDISGVVMTFLDRPTSLSGVVTGRSGAPDANASVLVLPADYQAWIDNGMPAVAARVVAASQTGAYVINDLRPGDFLVVAAGLDLIDRWQDPAFVRGLAAGGVRVTLTGGAANVQDLRIR